MFMSTTKDHALSEMAPGAKVKITAFAGGREFKHRLLGLGLTIGSEVEVLKGAQGRRNPVLIGMGGNRLMVGHGMAEKIMVSPAESGRRKAEGGKEKAENDAET